MTFKYTSYSFLLGILLSLGVVNALSGGSTAKLGQFPHYVTLYGKSTSKMDTEKSFDSWKSASKLDKAKSHVSNRILKPIPSKNEGESTTDVKSTTQYNFVCGGSLLSMSIFITAAQCFENRKKENMKVVAGSIHSDYLKAKTEGQVANILDWSIHPEFKRESDVLLHNDIALGIVVKGFMDNENIKPIIHAMPGMNELPKEGEIQAMGCEKKDYSCINHQFPEVLKYKKMMKMPEEQCIKKVSHVSNNLNEFPKDVFCIEGEENSGTGYLDFGSPYVIKMYGKSYLSGVHSGTKNCNLGCAPTLITDVRSHFSFICKAKWQLKFKESVGNSHFPSIQKTVTFHV